MLVFVRHSTVDTFNLMRMRMRQQYYFIAPRTKESIVKGKYMIHARAHTFIDWDPNERSYE